MKEQPIVSVIIPVKNTGKYINKCLDSIISQTLKIIEIKDNKPIWKQKKCTLCFAFMHICPAQAINYGNVLFFFDSKNKGRYRNPYAPKSY